MKKLLSLALLLCLLAGILSADAEEGEGIPGTGYDFDFVMFMHTDAFTDQTAERIQGYADLLDAMEVKGSILTAKEGDLFDLNLSIIPKASPSGAFDLRIRGSEDLMYLTSGLLGDKTVKLSNFSMLGFCTKMSEHLGIPLQYPALLFPYTWKYCLNLPLIDWGWMVTQRDEQDVIPPEAVTFLRECWEYRLERDEPLKMLTDALCKDSDAEEAFRGFLAEIPDYFTRQIAQDREIRILQQEGETVWRTATGDIFREELDASSASREVFLPQMQTGYLPAFSVSENRDGNWYTCRLNAQILGQELAQPDLVNLQASLTSFPAVWPMDCSSLLSLNLTGTLLPNAGFSAYLTGEKNGHVTVTVRKPTVEMEPGAEMLTLEGSLLPREGEVLADIRAEEEPENMLDLFVSNDTQIQSFLPDLVEPLLQGMIRFLVGIPTTACQAILDDLTEMGVFGVLMGK